jgi:hypothetical protein
MKFIELTPLCSSRKKLLNVDYIYAVTPYGEDNCVIDTSIGPYRYADSYEESYGQVAAMLCVHANVATATYTVNGVTKYDK